MNFGYREDGIAKQALVKLRVCPECASKLNYKKQMALSKKANKRKVSNRSNSISTTRTPSRRSAAGSGARPIILLCARERCIVMLSQHCNTRLGEFDLGGREKSSGLTGMREAEAALLSEKLRVYL